MGAATPQVVYLHGFASGPRSSKAVTIHERLVREGIRSQVPDLNIPDFEHLRVSRAIAHVVSLVQEPTVLCGSSLGGLMALHVARHTPHVRGLVLVAPALYPDERWKGWIGEKDLLAWRTTGTRRFHNFVTNNEREIDYGFYEDLLVHGRAPAPTVPTHVVHGRRDEQVPFQVSERLAKENPAHVKLEVVDDDHALLAHTTLIGDRLVALVRSLSSG